MIAVGRPLQRTEPFSNFLPMLHARRSRPLTFVWSPLHPRPIARNLRRKDCRGSLKEGGRILNYDGTLERRSTLPQSPMKRNRLVAQLATVFALMILPAGAAEA